MLPNTEPTRRYNEPDELPSVAIVLARRRWREGESHVCDRGEVVFIVEGVESAVNLMASLLSGTTMASHPRESDVRIEGITIYYL